LHEWNLNGVFRLKGTNFALEKFSTMTGGAFLLSQKSPVKLRVSRGAFSFMTRRFPPPWFRQHRRLGFKKGTSVRLLLLKNFGQRTTAQAYRGKIIKQASSIVISVCN
jgi:hypothetical protein